MHFKMIIAFIEDDRTNSVLQAAREAGATGSTIINNARGEGINKKTTFLGMELESSRDVLLFLVEEHLSRHILEEIERAGKLNERDGAGIAVQIDVEDAVGVSHHVRALEKIVEEEL